MKKITLTFCGLAIAFFALAQELALTAGTKKNLVEEMAAFTWDRTEYNFGNIPLGTPVVHEFSFYNTGTTPLVISSVQASCGCTVTAYSKDPIEPGARGYVKATYNAAKVGQFSKTVTVNANTDGGAVLLTIKGEVVTVNE